MRTVLAETTVGYTWPSSQGMRQKMCFFFLWALSDGKMQESSSPTAIRISSLLVTERQGSGVEACEAIIQPWHQGNDDKKGRAEEERGESARSLAASHWRPTELQGLPFRRQRCCTAAPSARPRKPGTELCTVEQRKLGYQKVAFLLYQIPP